MTKAWKVGEHRVKKYTKNVKKPEMTFGAYGQQKRSTKVEKVTRYKCVDCEKDRGNRKKFKETECFEVIEVEDES